MAVTDKSARMRLISTMLAGCPGSAATVTEFTVDAYLIAVEHASLEALAAACRSYLTGEARQYAPSASELGKRCRMMVAALPDPRDGRDMRNLTAYPIGAPVPAGKVPAGLVSVDFGRGKIDMTKLTYAQQEATLRSQGIASGAVRPQLRKMR